jgi:PAS domain S-box-containing protein
MDGTNIIPDTDSERIMKIHKDRMEGHISNLNYSMQLVTKNKSLIDVELQSTTVEFEGKPAGFMTLHNVTESKRMQRALEESEKKYRELTEMLPQTVYELDKNGNILFFNQTGFLQFGLDESDLGTSSFCFIAPEQHAEMRANMHKTLTEGKISFGNKYTAVRKNGTTFPALTFAAPIISDKEVVGIRGLILDISEHEAMEKAVRESEKKYRTLIDKATDGILITQDGVFKFVNPAFCEMMQYVEKELINKPFIDVVDKEHHAEMLENHKRRMTGESFPAIYRAKLYRKDGSNIMVELNSRTTDFEGNPASFVITRDITDRLQIEEELRKAKKELELLNQNLEIRVQESTFKLTEANTQLIRLQKENLQSQFEVLRQQVNPHFLFNSLNVLTSLIKLDPDLAEQFTEHLSKVYRYVLENKDNDLVSLQTELDFLDAYIFLLHIRFMDKIEVKVSISDAKRELLILPLALQLLIENAIKHNSMSKKNPLIIEIAIDSNNVLMVENNLQERESHMASTGVGLRNIAHRYQLLEMPEPEFIKTETKFIARVPLKC